MTEHTTAELFNVEIRNIFTAFVDMKSSINSGLHIGELQNRVNRGMRVDEEYAVEALNGYIWNNRDDIKSLNDEVFLKRKYNVELMKLSMKHGFDYEDSVKAVKFMKKAYTKATDEQKEVVQKAVFELVKLCAKWKSEQ